MQLNMQVFIKENKKEYDYLKSHSYLIKQINRNTMDYKTFSNIVKKELHERNTDKINQVIDNIELVSSVLDIIK